MIRHIVLFRVGTDDPAERERRVGVIAGALEPLVGVVPGVRSLTVDPDPDGAGTHWDAALVSMHDSWEALAQYQAHPEHVAAAAIVNTVATDRAVVDAAEREG